MKMSYFYVFLVYFYIVNLAESSPGRNRRIVNEDFAEKDQFPYIVSLQIFGDNFCGAGIIAEQYLLSAAHCILNFDGSIVTERIKAVMGTIDAKVPEIRINVDRMYLLKEFYFGGKFDVTRGDIAVLKLQRPIGLVEKAFLKKLELSKDRQSDYVGEEAIVAGFGFDHVEETIDEKTGKVDYLKSSDRRLRFAVYTVISKDECDTQNIGQIDDTAFCAKVKPRNINNQGGTCQGDSGGPLVQKDGSSYIVIGIVSRGPPNCGNTAGIYTKVTSHMNFIEDAMNDIVRSSMRVAIWKWSWEHLSKRFVESGKCI